MRRVIPGRDTLAHWVDEGLTHQQMADRVFEQTGERVTRSAISMALRRHNLVTTDLPRYHEEIPWRVKVEHLRAYPVRMLRLLGRRNLTGELNPAEDERLENWLALLEKENAVVAYDPDSTTGFMYVPREDGDPLDVPIRVHRVWVSPPSRDAQHTNAGLK